MASDRSPLLVALTALAVAAFAIALLAIVDLALPKPWDGVVLEADTPGSLVVSAVVARSGAESGVRDSHPFGQAMPRLTG